MNEEEKKAYNFYKELNEADLLNFEHLSKSSQEQVKYMETILHLIDKQQKEIEELQKYMKTNLIPKSTINLLYISKDKIREKIKEIDKDELLQKIDFGQISLAIKVLYELLEDNK